MKNYILVLLAWFCTDRLESQEIFFAHEDIVNLATSFVRDNDKISDAIIEMGVEHAERVLGGTPSYNIYAAIRTVIISIALLEREGVIITPDFIAQTTQKGLEIFQAKVNQLVSTSRRTVPNHGGAPPVRASPPPLEDMEAIWDEITRNPGSKRIIDALIAIAKNMSHAEQWRAIEDIYKFHSSEAFHIQTTLIAIANTPDHPHQWGAIARIKPEDIGRPIRDFLIAIANKADHPRRWDAIAKIRPEDIEPIRDFLIAIANTSDHPRRWDAIAKIRPEDIEPIRDFLIAIANKAYHPHQWDSIAKIRPEDIGAIREGLIYIANKADHPHQWDAIAKIRPEDTASIREGLIYIANKADHPHQWDAIAKIRPEDIGAIRDGIIHIAKKADHPHQYKALEELWNDSPARRDEIHPFLRVIAKTPGHIDAWNAINKLSSRLFYSYSVPEDTASIREGLIYIANTPDHPHQWGAIARIKPEDTASIREGLIYIANKADHPHQWDAIAKIRPEDIGSIRDVLIHIANTADHPLQFKAIYQLGIYEDKSWQHSNIQKAFEDNLGSDIAREGLLNLMSRSPDPRDKEIALLLMAEYDLFSLNLETHYRMGMYNRKRIRVSAPKLLKDISGFEDKKIVTRFKALMDQMNIREPFLNIETKTRNPTYVHVSAIDPDLSDEPNIEGKRYVPDKASILEMERIKGRVQSFLKILVQEALAPDDVRVHWLMHEDKRKGMIIALKNIIIALEEKIRTDPITASHNTGVIMQGILHCQAGQNEGIANTVHTVIYSQHNVNDLTEKMDFIIHNAVKQAFTNAFQGDGNVHNLARFRSLFHSHIGVGEGIEGFQDRGSSSIQKNEIPEIFKRFYDQFTREHIIKIVRGSISLEGEAEVPGRPVTISEIGIWLFGKGVKPNDEDDIGFRDYGIDDKFTEITDDGIWKLLQDMGYVNAPNVLGPSHVDELGSRAHDVGCPKQLVAIKELLSSPVSEHRYIGRSAIISLAETSEHRRKLDAVDYLGWCFGLE